MSSRRPAQAERCNALFRIILFLSDESFFAVYNFFFLSSACIKYEEAEALVFNSFFPLVNFLNRASFISKLSSSIKHSKRLQ